jgi:hypothetical protein
MLVEVEAREVEVARRDPHLLALGDGLLVHLLQFGVGVVDERVKREHLLGGTREVGPLISVRGSSAEPSFPEEGLFVFSGL